MKDERVVVIGGGPAGLMAAVTAARQGRAVVLVEKNNSIGKKLKITGGGRCNITNDCSMDQMMEKIITNPKFMYRSFNLFSNKNLIYLLESNGCKVKIEDSGKVFPISNNSQDVINVFEKLLKKHQIKLMLGEGVQDIMIDDSHVKAVKLTGGKELQCQSIVLATGGMSYPHLGSNGEGYKIAQKLGHSIVEVKPSLVPIVLKDKWVKELMGISLNNIKVYTKASKGKKLEVQGDVIFTHYGISGPAILEMSGFLIKKFDIEGQIIYLDLLPDYSLTELEKILTVNPDRKPIKSYLLKRIPKNMVRKIFEIANVPQETRGDQLKNKELNKFLELLKNFPLIAMGFRSIKEAIITSGGISVKEIDPQTMASKLIKGLYFAGEIIDIDALTGGYNLQIAFSTGYTAGLNASNILI